MAVGKNELVLELGKHFLIIDSNKSFVLEDNQGFRAYRPAGAWQIDCWKLLPAEWHKIYPVYTLKIEWENSEADKDYIPTINATDLDLGDGIAGVSGQPVNITTPVTVANLPNVIVGEQNTVPVHIETGLNPLEVINSGNNVIDRFSCGTLTDKDFDNGVEYRIFIKRGFLRVSMAENIDIGVMDIFVKYYRESVGSNVIYTVSIIGKCAEMKDWDSATSYVLSDLKCCSVNFTRTYKNVGNAVVFDNCLYKILD